MLDIRIELDDFPPTKISFMGRTVRFGHWTIRFKNRTISSYIVESSAISLITAMIALFLLSAGLQYATLRDFEWVAAVWAFGTFLHVPVLLWVRVNRPMVCEYCQKRPPFNPSKYCKTCNEVYGLQEAHDAADRVVQDHIQRRYQERG